MPTRRELNTAARRVRLAACWLLQHDGLAEAQRLLADLDRDLYAETVAATGIDPEADQ